MMFGFFTTKIQRNCFWILRFILSFPQITAILQFHDSLFCWLIILARSLALTFQVFSVFLTCPLDLFFFVFCLFTQQKWGELFLDVYTAYVIYCYDKTIFANTLRLHWFKRTQIEQFFRLLKHTLQIVQAKTSTKHEFECKLLRFAWIALHTQLLTRYLRKRFK